MMCVATGMDRKAAVKRCILCEGIVSIIPAF